MKEGIKMPILSRKCLTLSFCAHGESGRYLKDLLTFYGLLLFLPIIGSKTVEICEWDRFSPTCAQNEVVLMTSAFYGRMKVPGKCLQQEIGQGCRANALPVLDAACSGSQNCSITVPNADLAALKNGCKEMASYLEASYVCKPVEMLVGSFCNTCDYVKASSSTSGYISSYIAHKTGCGSTKCPWKIEVGQGQRIKVTLIDFSANNEMEPTYRVYATIRNSEFMARGDSHSITGDSIHSRELEVFISNGTSIEVRIMGQTGTENIPQHKFLLRYEAIGCTDISGPVGGWSKRKDDIITAGCEEGDTRWTLKCVGTKWQGSYDNCTQDSHFTSPMPRKSEFFTGMSLVIIAGVAVIICTVVVTIGLTCYKIHRIRIKRSRPRQSSASYQRAQSCHVTEDINLTWPRDYKEHVCPGQTTTLPRECVRECRDKNQYTHIWESPLPSPKVFHS